MTILNNTYWNIEIDEYINSLCEKRIVYMMIFCLLKIICVWKFTKIETVLTEMKYTRKWERKKKEV